MFPKSLRIAVLPLRHLLELNASSDGTVYFKGGVEARFIAVLSEALGFGYRLLMPEDREWGQRDAEGRWTGVVGMVHRNEADIAVAHLTITEPRMEAADFLPYTIEQNTFCTANPRPLPKSQAYLGPFGPALWAAILVTLVLAPLLFRILCETNRVPFLHLLGGVLGQPVLRSKERLLLAAWLLFALVLSTSYKAVLLSALAVPAYEGGVRDIRALAAAVEGGAFALFASRGSVDRELLIGSHDPAMRVIGRGVIEADWAGEDGAVSAPRAITLQAAVLGPRFFFRLEYGEPPFATHFIFPESVSFWYVGVAIRKGFCCRKELESRILRLMSTGIYDKFYDEELFKARMRFSSAYRHHQAPLQSALSVGDFFGPFAAVGLGLVLSTLVFVLELAGAARAFFHCLPRL